MLHRRLTSPKEGYSTTNYGQRLMAWRIWKALTSKSISAWGFSRAPRFSRGGCSPSSWRGAWIAYRAARPDGPSIFLGSWPSGYLDTIPVRRASRRSLASGTYACGRARR